VDCRHEFLFPPPTEDALGSFYETARGYTLSCVESAHEGAEEQYRDLLRWLSRATGLSTGSLLDFGCADGGFLREAAARGWSVVGYEPTAHLAEAARRWGLAIHSEPRLDDVGIAPESLDVVHCSHVLEHLPAPRRALGWMHRVLRPGGWLVVQVPNQFRDLLWPVLHRRWVSAGMPLGLHVHHLQFFHPRSLVRCIGACGFRVIAASTHLEPRNRRTVLTSKSRAVSLAKAVAYRVGAPLGRGPHIEVLARRHG
jgi:2-polyprenyl-3-methyl-5-hydroxy-6-metoxy-1,4-benzoquinol methylase